MDCPICGSAGRVLESRQLETDPPITRRRRSCNQNGHRYTSWESTHFPFVRKRNGELVGFDEAKLRKSILAATASLPPGAWGKCDEMAVVTDLVEDVKNLAETSPQRYLDAMSTREIGSRVLDRLHEYDQTDISHWRYATVFFKDRGYSTIDELDAAIREEQNQQRLWVGKARRPGEHDDLPASEPFSHSKLRRSLELAFSDVHQRALIEDYLEEIVAEARTTAELVPEVTKRDIEGEDPDGGADPESAKPQLLLTISSAKLGAIVLDRLLAGDHKFAYARFASAHTDYGDNFDTYVAEMSKLAAGDHDG